MKIIEGLDDARSVLLKDRSLDFKSVPEHVQRRTKDVFGCSLSPAQVVEKIVVDVRIHGDKAVRMYETKLNGNVLDSIEIKETEVEEALRKVPKSVIQAMKIASDRIRKFHENSMPTGWHDSEEGYGEIFVPVDRVGVYVPGGTALFPSTVLMTVIPAKVAGVEQVFMATPSLEDGVPHPLVLAASHIAGSDRVFAISGAQAVAAMAYGTDSIPRVDLVCGPGNVFVTLAKKYVFGDVGVDGLFGPTETLLIADDSANVSLCAADLIAQAEHDELATPVLITTSTELSRAILHEIGIRTNRLERGQIVDCAIENRGCIVIVDNLGQAFDLANEFAPEHLSLVIENPRRYVDRIRNAGAIFLGDFSHEVLGDYVAGPSHVMPTGGTARFNSGVNVRTFLKSSPVVDIEEKESVRLGKTASILARAEGFTGHAEAAEIRDELIRGEG